MLLELIRLPLPAMNNITNSINIAPKQIKRMANGESFFLLSGGEGGVSVDANVTDAEV